LAKCRDLCEWFGVSRTRATIHHWYQSYAEHYDQGFTVEPDRVAVNEKQIQLPVSSGTIYNLTKRVADRLRPAYENIKARIRDSDVIYCNETGFPVDEDQHWVWTFVTDEEVFYTINESCGSQALEEVLGEFIAEDAMLIRPIN